MKLSILQLERLIESKIQQILYEIDLDKKIKNPDTGRMIRIGSALSYDEDTKVFQKAKALSKVSDKKTKIHSSNIKNKIDNMSFEQREQLKKKIDNNINSYYDTKHKIIKDLYNNTNNDFKKVIDIINNDEYKLTDEHKQEAETLIKDFHKIISKNPKRAYDKEFLRDTVKIIAKKIPPKAKDIKTSIVKSFLSAAKKSTDTVDKLEQISNKYKKINDIKQYIDNINNVKMAA